MGTCADLIIFPGSGTRIPFRCPLALVCAVRPWSLPSIYLAMPCSSFACASVLLLLLWLVHAFIAFLILSFCRSHRHRVDCRLRLRVRLRLPAGGFCVRLVAAASPVDVIALPASRFACFCVLVYLFVA